VTSVLYFSVSVQKSGGASRSEWKHVGFKFGLDITRRWTWFWFKN